MGPTAAVHVWVQANDAPRFTHVCSQARVPMGQVALPLRIPCAHQTCAQRSLQWFTTVHNGLELFRTVPGKVLAPLRMEEFRHGAGTA